MPAQPLLVYPVTFPDGHQMDVTAPEGVEPSVVFAKALQDRAVQEGKIQTSWLGGAAKQMGQEKTANTALATGAALATGGTAGAVAAAASPLASTWLDYATKKFTGEKPALPSATEQALDVAGGAASLVPAGSAAKAVASKLGPAPLKALLKVKSFAELSPLLDSLQSKSAAIVKPAVEAAEASGSYLHYLTGNAMVNATDAERMILARQRALLNDIAKSDAAKAAAETAAKAYASAKTLTPSVAMQALQAGIRAAYKTLVTTGTSALTQTETN